MAPLLARVEDYSNYTMGWISQPDGRGTIDIIQSSLITLLLCSWSVLALNIPHDDLGILGFFLYKVRWMLFTVFFPEVTTALSANQWRTAIQSVDDFSSLQKEWEAAVNNPETQPDDLDRVRENLKQYKETPWTMRHAFFADMGGIMLDCPDFVPFPVDGQQLGHLVRIGFLNYPAIEQRMIWDKNKADIFARLITLVQIVWFLLQSFGRVIQRLSMTTLELSTLSVIFCTVNTFFFWLHKPLDCETPITLPCDALLADIITNADTGSSIRYCDTPLEFIKPSHTRASISCNFWVGVEVCFRPNAPKKRIRRPIRTFGNTRTVPPRGLTTNDMVYGAIFTLSYLGIHLAGWNFPFPTWIERQLWRIFSLVLLGLLSLYLAGVAAGEMLASKVAKWLFSKEGFVSSADCARLLPRWAAIALHLPFYLVYAMARAYLVAEGLASLRSQPASVYSTVDWQSLFPHLT